MSIKSLGKRLLSGAGYEMRARQWAGSVFREIGRQDSVFADFRARGFRPSLIFDVGAANGTWTRDVRPIFPEARFVLVEPRTTSIEPTVRAAIGAQTGTLTLTDWDTGSTLIPQTDPEGAAQYQVPVTTLDVLAQHLIASSQWSGAWRRRVHRRMTCRRPFDGMITRALSRLHDL